MILWSLAGHVWSRGNALVALPIAVPRKSICAKEASLGVGTGTKSLLISGCQERESPEESVARRRVCQKDSRNEHKG